MSESLSGLEGVVWIAQGRGWCTATSNVLLLVRMARAQISHWSSKVLFLRQFGIDGPKRYFDEKRKCGYFCSSLYSYRFRLSFMKDIKGYISKCQERARQSVWWPGLSQQIDETIKSCHECCKSTRQSAEQLIPSSLPELPWQKRNL